MPDRPKTVVLVLALAAGGWLLLRPGDVRPAADDAKAADGQGRLDVRETVERAPATTRGVMAHRFSVDDMSPGESYEMPGMWATDKVLAKGVTQTLLGLRIGTAATPGDEQSSSASTARSAGRPCTPCG